MGSTLCAKFALECDNLVGSCSKFDITPLENLTESLLETKLQSLEEDWQSVRKAFEDLILTNENIIPESEKCTAKVRFGSVKDEYQRTKANMMDQLKMHRASSNQGLRPDQPTNSTLFNTSNMYPINATFNDSEICIKVPPCDTQEFYGGYEEWPSFRDMFTAIYGNHPRLTQAQKLYHLRNKTKGEAGSIVAKYPLSDQNYLLAWDALRARYENKRILVDNQLKILFNIPAAKAENCESINRIQTTISDCLSILKAHGIRTDQWDPILIYLCSTKLPDETLALWEQSLSSPTRLPSWAEMEEFLINRHQVMERMLLRNFLMGMYVVLPTSSVSHIWRGSQNPHHISISHNKKKTSKKIESTITQMKLH